MADVGQTYGAGATVGLNWVKSMGQSCSWEHVGQIYGAGAAVGLMLVLSIRHMKAFACGFGLFTCEVVPRWRGKNVIILIQKFIELLYKSQFAHVLLNMLKKQITINILIV